MITKNKVKKELKRYINSETISEDLTSNDLREIRKIIRVEVAEIFFDLFKKRGTWV